MIRSVIENIKTAKAPVRFLALFSIFLIPIMLYLFLAARYSINVPFWDEWSAVDLYRSLKGGDLTLNALWIPHNEHRSILFYVVYLAIAWFSDFNAIAPLYFGIAFKFVTLLLILDLLYLTLRKHSNAFLLIAVFSSIFVFAAQEGELVFWGFASLLFNMSSLFTILLFWGLVRYPGKFNGVLIASLAAICGSLISANGIFLWGLGGLYIILDRLLQRKNIFYSHLYYWLLVMAIFLAIYFYDYHAVNTTSTLAWILSNKKMSVFYFLAYMASLTTYGSDSRAILFGGVGLFLFGINLLYFIAIRKLEVLRGLLPWFLLPVYVLLVALVTTAGRAQYGAWQAQSPRYVLFSYTFWLSLFVLSAVLLENLTGRFSLNQVTRNVLRLYLPVMFFVLPVSAAYMGAFINLVPYWHYRFSVGLRAVYEYPYASERALVYIFPNPAGLNERLKYLDENNLGPFAKSYRPIPENEFPAHSVPLPDHESDALDLTDTIVWSYQDIQTAGDAWKITGSIPQIIAANLPNPIYLNEYKYLYVEMAIPDVIPAPREFLIYFQAASHPSMKEAYLINIPIVTGNRLNAYNVDLSNYKFASNVKIVAIGIYPIGKSALQSVQPDLTLTIRNLRLIKK